MKIGIMQPYFFPYLGYWQLINAVDKYVIFDDVNYINRGWINRNRILVDGQAKYFNLPISKASQNKLINETYINRDISLLNKNLKTLEFAYHKAPFFSDVYPLIEKIILFDEEQLSKYLHNLIVSICDYLEIKKEFLMSSEIDKDNSLKGSRKILNICEKLGATEYYNAIGGKELYSKEVFNKRSIELKFLKMDDVTYKQFVEPFQANLSIIDVLMFNSVENVKNMLDMYSLE